MSKTQSFWHPLKLPIHAFRSIAIASLCLNLLAIALPIFTRIVYDRVVPNFAEATLWVLGGGMLLVLMFEVLFKCSRLWITTNLGVAAGKTLEPQFMQQVLETPANNNNMAKTSFLLHSIQEVRDFYTQKLLPTLIDLPFVLGFLLIIYLICPAMTLVPATLGLVIIALHIVFHSRLNTALYKSQQTTEERLQQMAELLNGQGTIRQLAEYKPFLEQWKIASYSALQQNGKFQFTQQLVASLAYSFIILNTVLLMMVGVYQIQAGNLTIGGMLAISLLSARILTPLTGIGEILAKWPKIKQQRQQLQEFMKQSAEQNSVKQELLGNLTVDDIVVQQNNISILKGCQFSLSAGEKLAVIGGSGTGKTTLLKALSLEVPVTGGRILWDDYANRSPKNLRQQMGIVEQHPYFFKGTIRSNLGNYSDAEMHVALTTVGLNLFLKQTGQGLDYPLTEGGLNLSGGQRQCLALARALVRQPKVLLLDEPTAMMDHESELRLVKNLEQALKDVTTIIITHRTPLLALVDKIAVMQLGSITKFGAAQQVLKELQNAA